MIGVNQIIVLLRRQYRRRIFKFSRKSNFLPDRISSCVDTAGQCDFLSAKTVRYIFTGGWRNITNCAYISVISLQALRFQSACGCDCLTMSATPLFRFFKSEIAIFLFEFWRWFLQIHEQTAATPRPFLLQPGGEQSGRKRRCAVSWVGEGRDQHVQVRLFSKWYLIELWKFQ